ncbi:hypothetical protein SpCBS45565_g00424 [Spizellomyces sp. 'palustris']|nr:hypothetical protein SpCBS45565_g00424 [Spizellomyces sp. 'palustris']
MFRPLCRMRLRPNRLTHHRFNTTEAAIVSPASTAFVTPAPEVPKRSGGGFFRGGIIGFLLGITLAGATSYVYLLDEYQQSSNALLSNVEDLAKSTAKLRDHTQKITTLEKDLNAFTQKAATKGDLQALRNELLKLIDEVNVSHLELKTHVWEIEQDVKAK